ncbi:MAG TPA: diguanylate cyclase [Edaphobacter sp.]
MAETKVTWDQKHLPLVIGNFLACAITIWLTYRVIGHVKELVFLWPLTGVQLGILLPQWRCGTPRKFAQFAGALGVMAGGFLLHEPLWFPEAIAFISTVEVWIAGAILSKDITTFEDLKNRRSLLQFALGATVGPVSGGFIGAIPVTLLLHTSYARNVTVASLSDSLGIGLVLPAMLFILTGKYRNPLKLVPRLKMGGPALLFFILCSIATFWQTSNPFLFMIFPPMILLVLSMALEGAVLGSVALTIIGFYATIHGHGPLWLSKTTLPEERLLLLQLFLWMSIATSLPVGALLDEQRRAEKETSEARRIYQLLLENTEDMIVLSSFSGKERFVSAASLHLTGWTPEEFLKLSPLSTVHPDDRAMGTLVIESMMAGKREHTFRYRLAQKDGAWRWVEAYARTYLAPTTDQPLGYVGTIRDITAIKSAEDAWLREIDELSRSKQELSTLAHTDTLTGLPNRRTFDESVADVIVRAQRGELQAALFMIDIDNFKLYNDRYGHQAGDDCLRKVSAVLKDHAGRRYDVVARWGGEEFAILLYGTDLHGASAVANDTLESVRALRIEHAGNPPGIVTISMGIAMLTPEFFAEPSMWIQAADRALYLSKRSGRNRATSAGLDLLSA